ncbi:MAG: hypothetical protein KIT84_31060 [Labilithrix sp.]|nr:hypothetical protein [Labilithrix sp.]MCW5815509.1 hypothetical protein [Labilithrix sp.]
MSEERVERFSSAYRLRRNWFVSGGALLAAVLGIALCYVRVLEYRIAGMFLVWIGSWIAPLTFLRNSFPLARPARVEATPRALTIDGERIPVEDIAEARVVPRAVRRDEDVVELMCKGRRRVELSLPGSDAKRLLDTLGAGAGERRATFTRILPFGARFAWTCGLVGFPWFLILLATSGKNLVPMFFVVPFGILPVCALIAAIVGFIRGKVVIGAEGFTTRWYGLSRTYRFADVEHVTRKTKGFGAAVVDTVVVLHSQKRIAISILDAPDTHAQRGAETRACADTMEEAFERWQRAPEIAELGTHLGRGHRSASEWLAGIDQLIRGGAQSYRIAAVTPEVLADVTRSTEASTDTRVGAAAALLRLGDAAHRVTVRVAAEACAEPKMRAALLELVEAADDDAKVELALARVR